jgi:hypothetical protein
MTEPPTHFPQLESGPAVLRHFLVSLLYRFEHVTGDAPDNFATFDAGGGVRKPEQIVRHLTGLMRFAHENLAGPPSERLEPLAWERERRRFVEAVQALDASLMLGAEVSGEIALAQIWQGPMIDAMTHIGQLASLRRLAGAPIGPAGYWRVTMAAVADY